ncbi:hypothetical protein [Caproiciproducens faecalis]|uniref:Uncharacterized protein n=1 Tax=Caproiciproducens faecalis TaxID=2820301 RepID=A0ABS7DL40_9FIRM|nr:hypothetical protein [Caproiciproducens faecalis]MBW7571992.1 hypothetical protein [Caproiciproducens faecalis]
MQNQANSNEGASANSSGIINPSMNMQAMGPSSNYLPQGMPMMENMANQMVYPEIFYKLQPYIMLVCDQMDTFSSLMPTQEMVEHMTDSIYDDVCRMYPDIAEYTREYEKRAKDDPPDPPDPPAGFGRGFGRGFGMFEREPRFGFGFRRRGLFRDLIDILLLSELTRRRRRFY